MKGNTSPRTTSTTVGRRLIAIGLTLLLTSFFTATAFADEGDPYVTLDGVTWTGQNSVGDSGCELVLHEGDSEHPLSDYRFEYWFNNGAFDPLLDLPGPTYTFDLSAYEGEEVKVEVKGWLRGDPDSPLGPPLFNKKILIDCDEEPPTGSLSVTKDVVGTYTGKAEFGFTGSCDLGHLIANETFTLSDDETWKFEERIPAYLDGRPCTLKETETNGAYTVTYKLGDTILTPNSEGKVSFELSSTKDLVLTVVNDFTPPTARLKVTKDAVNYTGTDTFPFAGSCLSGETTTPISFSLADNGEWISDPFALGATCELRETNNRGATSVGYLLDGVAPTLQADGDVQVTMSTARTYTLAVTNTFPAPPPPPPTTTTEETPFTPLVPDIDLVKVADITPDDVGFRNVVFDPDEPLPTITYVYTVTNTGETTLSGVTVVDTPLGTVTLADTTLSVGESTSGILTHVLTLDDVEAGQIDNDATATGTAPNGTRVTDDDDETVYVIEVEPAEIVREPAITLDKIALVDPDENGDKVVEWQDDDLATITYQYTITNTGETALTGLVLVDDPLGTIPLPTDGLAVGEQLVVTFDHTVTPAEGELGEIVNTATATATSPDGIEVTATATETVLLVEVLPLIIEPETPTLPATGAAASTLLLAAGIALLLGAGTLGYDRRRR